ncbi:type II toxin-antitoxin system VapC family toxin [Paramicrobacterium agarici]|uniref:Ribonuclease VapC n=1 Tax=Paramicrobacterium agarici TaxID=630514 RepID=A0A2A9DYT5_9MICO|nr:type II toxin-antitoxin system VapC family toxin [Microbacterium agarici]PFG31848.1 hypothetical protein ATJ78_2829 [Microbacterium agarici]
MAFYLDTSALVKLVVGEAESAALQAWLVAQEEELVTSDLARTELMRAVRRASPEHAVRAQEVLDSLFVLTLPSSTYDAAARLDPPELRSLDALHLAAAFELGNDLSGVVVYDDRLAEAANAYGVTTVAPR